MADSWLIRDGMDRERMLDMDRRIQPLRLAALSILAVCLVASGPWLGYWTLILLVAAGVFFKIAGSRTGHVERPERTLFAGWAAAETMIMIAVALTGGVESPMMAWFAIPIVTLSARFSVRGVTVGVITVMLMMIGVTVAVSADALVDSPPHLMAPIALVIAAAILSTALMQSDVEHRTEAVIDPLTGLLNRNALKHRTVELAQRSELTADPVGVIVADIDHFKRINDTHGHPVGDAVLKDLAYLLREELRAFDLAYRIGGEEFLILLPGADIDEAVVFANSLHDRVRRSKRGGVDVTMSFGVSSSGHGELFDYDRVFAAADMALYDAKNSGRDRVCAMPSNGDGGAEARFGSRPRIAI
ncbi:MAG: diguanylate cyclase [Solirubrobacterales bacterium]